ncbi:MAG: tRNA pseudouridine(38-40) synthase TruA [Gemmatimonadetes bacterium]|nr:tRNA pseudouridine(38-40) synthase TruA [Gemmatimonadota bacterium]
MSTLESHRICLTLHYDGAAFFGWQLQPTERTVQGELERVLGRLFAAPVRVVGSGRTDRGVHASGQVAAVDAPGKWTPAALARALNALLPPEIWVADARPVPAAFHPRYGATSRSYVYRVGLAEVTRSPFHARWCWPACAELDTEAMGAAAGDLLGEHSFVAFAKAGQEERGDRCEVQAARWVEWPGLGLQFEISANRFLHHMVRYLVGTLVEIGRGRRPVGDMRGLLHRETRLGTSPPAPAEGLFLYEVTYPREAWGEAGPPPRRSIEHLP